MNIDEEKISIEDEIHNALKKLEIAAYKKGLREGASRMEMLSLLVPGSITKKDLIRLIKIESEILKKAEDYGKDIY